MKVKYYNTIKKVPELSNVNIDEDLLKIEEEYVFRTNDYYNSLINWDDPEDPLLNVIFPRKEELIEWGRLDASNESKYQKVKGLEHKYRSTALLLCNDVCGAYCRFCFRKRLFQHENEEVDKNNDLGIQYIKENSEISNVLLTGGDPLMMSNRRIETLLTQLKDISHLSILRFGTKMLAFNPMRIDEELLRIISDFNINKQVYMMVHYNHARELTQESMKAIRQLKETGVTILNQTPIIKRVNDNPETIRELHDRLSYVGVIPYYIFACRPTSGNYTYAVPIEKAYDIFIEATRVSSGIAKNARFILSHEKGKHEIIGKDKDYIFFRKHNVVDVDTNGMLIKAKLNENAYWLDDYDFND